MCAALNKLSIKCKDKNGHKVGRKATRVGRWSGLNEK
jgi:hypothetical protein